MKPLIGITTGEIDNKEDPWSPITYGQSHTYSDAIVAAGGLPVLIPLTEDIAVITAIYNRLDGILFAGGNDIDPGRYRQQPLEQTKDISQLRDKVEFGLMDLTLQDGKPALCICRGYQLLNIACGGSLYQDIPSQLPGKQNHSESTTKKDRLHIAHQLRIEPTSQLSQIVGGSSIKANTHHHQAVDQLGNDLVATAWAEDGIIEAIEKPGPYLIGVQCHPESLGSVEPAWNKLFNSFVEACALSPAA